MILMYVGKSRRLHCKVTLLLVAGFQERVSKVTTEIGAIAMKYDGTCTGEHGIGRGKKHLLRNEVGPETYALMHTVKKAIDPKGIMNPYKVFDP